MTRLKLTFMLMLAWGMIAVPRQGHAQTRTKFYNMELLREQYPWLDSENGAGLYALPLLGCSNAHVYFTKGNGEFRNYSDSPDSYEFGVNAESFFRISKRVAFHGKVKYGNFTGKSMAGSAFIDPYSTPFDILEFNDDNTGTKKREIYHISGAFGGDISRTVKLGLRFNYTAQNYAKRKDLRHVNNLLEMTVTAGAVFKAGNRVDIGADYFYRRRIEGVMFTTYAVTDKPYYSLISWGAFWGMKQVFSDSGFTEKNRENPMVDQYHGAGLQINWRIADGWNFLNEFDCKSRKGYFGKKSPNTVVYTNHDSRIIGYHGTLSFLKNRNSHNWKISADNEKLENRKNLYRFESLGGGINDVKYFGDVKTTDRKVTTAGVEYSAKFKTDSLAPVWGIKAEVHYYSRNTEAVIFPYSRTQTVRHYQAGCTGNYNFSRKGNLFAFWLGAGYAAGSGNPFQDHISGPKPEGTVPSSMDLYLHREYEYLTLGHFSGNFRFEYSLPLFNNKARGCVSADYAILSASKAEYLPGKTHHAATVSIGCSF